MDIMPRDFAALEARARGPSLRAVLLALAVQILCGLAGRLLLGSYAVGAAFGAGLVVMFCALNAMPILRQPADPSFWTMLRRDGWPILAVLAAALAAGLVGL